MDDKRKRIIQEIRDSELVFTQQLFTIQNMFVHPALTQGVCSTEGEQLLRKLPLSAIINFSKQMVGDLSKTFQSTTESVGKIFTDNFSEEVVSAFACYSSLYTKIRKWIHTLRVETKNGSYQDPFLEFLQRQEALPLITLDFASLLITGVQRPPRYSLLLRDLLKQTPCDHFDYPEIVKAQSLLENAIDCIDKQIGSYMDLLALQKFFSRFDERNTELDQYMGLNRKPLGSVTMTDDKHHRPHELFVLDDAIICARVYHGREQDLSFKWGSLLPLTSIQKSEKDSLCYSFEIRKGTNKFPFATFECYVLRCEDESSAKMFDRLLVEREHEMNRNKYFENYDNALKEIAHVRDKIMTSREWQYMIQGNEQVEFQKNETILDKNQPFSMLYYIKEGLVRVAIESDEVSSVLFRGIGTVLGELEFAAYKNGMSKFAQASLIAEENTVLVKIPYSSVLSMLRAPSHLTARFYYQLCCLLACISQQYLHYHVDSEENDENSLRSSTGNVTLKKHFSSLDINFTPVTRLAEDIVHQNKKKQQQEQHWWDSIKGSEREGFSCIARLYNHPGRLCVESSLVFIEYTLFGSSKITKIDYKKITAASLVGNELCIKSEDDEREFIFKIVSSKMVAPLYSSFLSKYSSEYKTPLQIVLQQEISHWESLCKRSKSFVTVIPKGTMVVNVRDNSQSVYYICCGKCQAITYSKDEEIIYEETLGDNDFFGFYGFLFGEYSPTSVITLEECEILSVSRSQLSEFVQNDFAAASALFAKISNSITGHIDIRASLVSSSMRTLSSKQPRSHIFQ